MREARVTAGMTQAVLAETLGVPQSWISNVESGARKIEVFELVEIALVLGQEPASMIRVAMREADET